MQNLVNALYESISCYSTTYQKTPHMIGVAVYCEAEDIEFYVGILSLKEAEEMVKIHQESARNYLFNAAEYEIYDDPSCNPTITLNETSEEVLFEDLKKTCILLRERCAENFETVPYLYFYALECDDIDKIIAFNFDVHQQRALKTLGYL